METKSYLALGILPACSNPTDNTRTKFPLADGFFPVLFRSSSYPTVMRSVLQPLIFSLWFPFNLIPLFQIPLLGEIMMRPNTVGFEVWSPANFQDACPSCLPLWGVIGMKCFPIRQRNVVCMYRKIINTAGVWKKGDKHCLDPACTCTFVHTNWANKVLDGTKERGIRTENTTDYA